MRRTLMLVALVAAAVAFGAVNALAAEQPFLGYKDPTGSAPGQYYQAFTGSERGWLPMSATPSAGAPATDASTAPQGTHTAFLGYKDPTGSAPGQYYQDFTGSERGWIHTN